MTSLDASDGSPTGDHPGGDGRLTVLIGADTFFPDVNGAARFAERLAAGLVARGHDVHVMAPSKTWAQHGVFREVIEGQEMTVHRIRSYRWYPHDWLRFVWPWRAKHYSRIVLDDVKPDVVHIQSHIVIGRALTRIARERGIPVVATNHVMPENILDYSAMPSARGSTALIALPMSNLLRDVPGSIIVHTPRCRLSGAGDGDHRRHPDLVRHRHAQLHA